MSKLSQIMYSQRSNHLFNFVDDKTISATFGNINGLL